MKGSVLRNVGMLFGWMIAATLMVGCTADEGGDGAAAAGGDVQSDVQFDLSEVGLRGMRFDEGEAVLLEDGLTFPGARVEIAGVGIMTLATESVSLESFDDPAIEFRGEPVRMLFRMRGEVSQDEAGQLLWTVDRVTPRMLDGDDQALGTNTAEEALEALRANGVNVPEVGDDGREVTLTVEVSDEDYSELSFTSDWEALQRFTGTRNTDRNF
ncbi:hypothetical protein ACERK3_00030 [Phycisphaerales bacterium AB-hyl4]|uniref:Lipoprotein n=1 Tax=Natronomicrosphaera hydrolytica TaxID=3242702 RepID=A0ABV4TZA7_9BACT